MPTLPTIFEYRGANPPDYDGKGRIGFGHGDGSAEAERAERDSFERKL